MQILIPIPSFLQPLLQWFAGWLVFLGACWTKIMETASATLSNMEVWWTEQVFPTGVGGVTGAGAGGGRMNALVPIFAILLVFWPVLLTLIVAMATASTWIFWVATSMILGLLQVLYVTYQFIMILLDILGLSGLKTYSMLRSQFLYHVENLFPSNTPAGKRLRGGKSRRRLWRQRIEAAKTYEDFLKIRIKAKDESLITEKIRQESKSKLFDSALPPPGQQHDENQQHQQVDQITTLGSPRKKKMPSPTSSPSSPFSSFNHFFSSHRDSIAVEKSKRDHEKDLGQQTSSPLAITRSTSSTDFGMNTSTAANHNNNASNTTSIPRNRSFDGNISKLSESERGKEHDDYHLDPVVASELGEKTAHLLIATTERLQEARLQAEAGQRRRQEQQENNNISPSSNKSSSSPQNHHHSHYTASPEESINSIKYLLSAVVKKNHLQLDQFIVDNARSIADCGEYGLTTPSRQLVRQYFNEVCCCLDVIADSDITIVNNDNEPSTLVEGEALAPEDPQQKRHAELTDRIMLLRKMKHNMGRTALMLSGGGAQAMYHIGVIKALIESKMYNDIKVISGTSGGSIIAGMCAIRTAEELYRDVCVSTVSTDFTRDGEQKRQNVCWFPPLAEMVSYWLKHKLLIDSAEFRRTCNFYYGDITFEEAYEKTNKHVCITVSASRVSGTSAQRLLLNHISTPHVTVASAVAASCALPGVMAPAKLLAKNSTGTLEPFEVDGVEWIDGSVQADLPFQRISTLFAVSSFVVSQTNFHIVPLMNKEHHPSRKSSYWTLFQTMEWDIRSRALKLSRLGLFPRMFGQDVSKIFKQKYHGDLTIVPRFTTMQTFGLKALSNPTVEDMEGYLENGQRATWPYINAIRDIIRLEKTLDDCLSRMEDRMRELQPDDADWLNHDDLESIASSTKDMSSASSRVRIIGRPPSMFGSFRETERMKRKMTKLEQENELLKKQLEALQKATQSNLASNGTLTNDTNKSESARSPLSDGSEGRVWNMVLGRTSSK
jgi:predicted acylesterase/phospholipase RssA